MEASTRASFDRHSTRIAGLLFASFAVFPGAQMGSALFPGPARLWSLPVASVARLASVWRMAGMLAPLLGPLSDSFGHWRLFFIGGGVIVAGSLLSSGAPGLGMVVAGQALVGLG